MGCDEGFFIDSPNGPECADLVGTIDRMEDNFEDLRRERDRLARPPVRLERQRIEAALAAHGCSGDPVAEVAPPEPPMSRTPDRRSASLAPDTPSRAEASRLDRPGDEDAPGDVHSGMLSIGPDVPYGRYRTLCVRSCDGYYFPISFGATPDQFARDQNSCQAQCPGAELYYTRPDEEPNKMMSLAGKPYTALPNAFKYRKTGPLPACSCHVASAPNAGVTILGNGSKPLPSNSASTVPLPTPRPDAPDILEQKAPTPASDKSAATAANAPQPSTANTEQEKPKVRVVGPRFLPDPSTAIDLKAPDRSDDR